MTAEKEKTLTRRNFLAAAAAVLGLFGIGSAAVPFIRAMSPGRDILAAGRILVDISDMVPGDLKTAVWRKQPVFILKRTAQMISLDSAAGLSGLIDPAPPEQRAKDQDLFVALGICTHLGCIPKFRQSLPEFNKPGFYCPCHGGVYDSLGRRLAGPPSENLHLVPYRLLDEDTLEIGSETFAGFGADIRTIDRLPQT